MPSNTLEDITTLRNKLFASYADNVYRNNDGDKIYKRSKIQTQIIPNDFLISSNVINTKKNTIEGKKTTILDKLRLKTPSVDDDDMDLQLPTINHESNALSVYSLSNSSHLSTKLGIYNTAFESENAFANKSLVPSMPSFEALSSKPHSQWKLQKVLLGHTGTVTALTFDPLNKFFVSGSSDSTMKVWDLITGELKVTLTGHIMAVRGLVISPRHPYMFSCSEDKCVKCWDLEKNKVVRDYHGHLSSVYSIDIHPTLDLIVTGGRDSSVKVWDIRTKLPVYTLVGHKSTVNKVSCRSTNPQVISCSMDSTVKTWDLIAGKCDETLTYHSKSVRSFFVNDDNDEFISGSSDGIKKFKITSPGGRCKYLQDLQSLENDKLNRGNLIVNTITANHDGDLFIGCDNGQYGFWDWESGRLFQNGMNVPVPGSLEGEKGILCSSFDQSGLRLVTGSVDKSVKIWKQVDELAI
ncbi:unnamed protein product [Ambrosiozyma monospora]|uniref:Unnamed protein product n=2 Tax=Ambrosiozyma monospora TaxID=43982 RepID=A0ACB5SZG7_AMBMO|nr:unnamed protein product [Ambrosiozyma monospora]